MSTEAGWDLDGGQKKEFTKFPVGTTRIRVLDSAPHRRWTHWIASAKRAINCPGMNICPIDDIIDKQKANKEPATYNRAQKFSLNIFNYETGKVEIMEQGKGFMEDLKLVMSDLKAEGKGLSDAILKVRRTGSGKDDTKYRIDVLEHTDEPIPEGTTDLAEYFKPHTVEQITRIVNGEAWADVMGAPKEEEDAPAENDEEIEIE